MTVTATMSDLFEQHYFRHPLTLGGDGLGDGCGYGTGYLSEDGYYSGSAAGICVRGNGDGGGNGTGDGVGFGTGAGGEISDTYAIYQTSNWKNK